MQRTDSLEKTDAGKDWRQEEKGMTEDEMVGWHYQLSGHEFEQAPGVGDGQGSLCSPWGRKESDMTEWLNRTEIRVWNEEKGVVFIFYITLYFVFHFFNVKNVLLFKSDNKGFKYTVTTEKRKIKSC